MYVILISWIIVKCGNHFTIHFTIHFCHAQVCAVHLSSGEHHHDVLLCGAVQRLDGVELPGGTGVYHQPTAAKAAAHASGGLHHDAWLMVRTPFTTGAGGAVSDCAGGDGGG